MSVSSKGVYGGTPHIEAISMSSMRSDSDIENCFAILATDTRSCFISHGSMRSKPLTRTSEDRGPRLALMIYLRQVVPNQPRFHCALIQEK